MLSMGSQSCNKMQPSQIPAVTFVQFHRVRSRKGRQMMNWTDNSLLTTTKIVLIALGPRPGSVNLFPSPSRPIKWNISTIIRPVSTNIAISGLAGGIGKDLPDKERNRSSLPDSRSVRVMHSSHFRWWSPRSPAFSSYLLMCEASSQQFLHLISALSILYPLLYFSMSILIHQLIIHSSFPLL